MKSGTVLVLGAGIQGRAAIQDLERSPGVDRVVAADLDRAALERYLAGIGATKTEPAAVDVSDPAQLRRLLAPDVGVAVALVPARLERAVAEAAIASGTHLVTTNFATSVEPLDADARARGVAIVPEAGFDPGIDLLIVARAVAEFDRVDVLKTYGSGIPAPECRDTNALNYKISWSWEGALAAYSRAARLIVDRREVVVPRFQIFRPEWRHAVTVDGAGELEAYVDGDAVAVAERAGIRDTVRTAARFTLRWPGHGEFWDKVARLGLLEEGPRDFLRRYLEPQLQYGPAERDMIILRVDVEGVKDGRRQAQRYELIDFRDLDTGALAMSRAVGYTASVVAQFVLSGAIDGAGVLSPIRAVPVQPFFDALAARGIRITSKSIPPETPSDPARR